MVWVFIFAMSQNLCKERKLGKEDEIMKIVDVETYMLGNPDRGGGRNWIFIKLVTDGEIEAIGD